MILPKLVFAIHFSTKLVSQMCFECRTHIQSMAIGTTLFAASIFEMAVHASADVFALCCQSPCLVRAIHFRGRSTNGFAGRIANERAQLTLVDWLANEQFRLDETVETESS